MPIISPFRGIRYNLEKVDLAKVIAPPYDVISEELQDKLYKRSEYNIIRLILGKIYPTDNPENNRYTRARDTFMKWLEDNILITENFPAIYIYQQRFNYEDVRYTRTGFIALCKLEELGKKDIHPHEKTLSSPKEDRLLLMKECKANFSQIFGIVEDEDSSLKKQVLSCIDKDPQLNVITDEGVEDSIWIISDRSKIEMLQSLLKDRRVFIADGHHRYETALLYQKEHKVPGPWDWCMMFFISMNDEGLKIFPTHRVLYNVPTVDLKSALKDNFEVINVENLEDIKKLLKQDFEKNFISFGVYEREGIFYLIRLKDVNIMKSILPDTSEDYRTLDVVVLHKLIFEKIFNIDEEKLLRKENIDYYKDVESAIKKIKEKANYKYLFILNPTRLSQVKAISLNGEKMPQKSTYFYPKLTSGLVIRRMEK